MGITGHVRDQSNRGSCWAFGSTEAFNDRYCIKTGDATTLFSPEDTVSCCDYADDNTGKTCRPYTLESCAHHVAPVPPMVACTDLNGGNEYHTPKCISTCEDNYDISFSKDKHLASSSYGIRGVENMQKELMEKGTLSVAFTVYEDFEAYTGGVYQHTTGRALGGHAIKMIGWGVDNGTPYWICTNSWNDSWGEQGTFRILRGQNECGIEGSVVAGDA